MKDNSDNLCYNCGKEIKGKKIEWDICDPWNPTCHIVYFDEVCWNKVKPK